MDPSVVRELEQALGPSAVLTNAAGRGSTLKEYGALMAEDDRSRAGAFAVRVRDVTEFLGELGLSAPLRQVTPPPSCTTPWGG